MARRALPHRKKVLGLNPLRGGPDSSCVEFACFPCVCVGFLCERWWFSQQETPNCHVGERLCACVYFASIDKLALTPSHIITVQSVIKHAQNMILPPPCFWCIYLHNPSCHATSSLCFEQHGACCVSFASI